MIYDEVSANYLETQQKHSRNTAEKNIKELKDK